MVCAQIGTGSLDVDMSVGVSVAAGGTAVGKSIDHLGFFLLHKFFLRNFDPPKVCTFALGVFLLLSWPNYCTYKSKYHVMFFLNSC